MTKKNILIFTDYYLPGYRAGGPIRSVSNLVDWLGDEFNFHIVTSAYDYGTDISYPGIAVNEWTSVGKARVHYLKKGMISFKKVKQILRDSKPELVLFNSFFSPRYTIIPLTVAKFSGLFKNIPVLLAPRGEFSSGTLAIKSAKKNLFLRLASWLGIYSEVNWAFTNEKEEKEFHDNIGLTYQSAFRFPNLPKKSSESSVQRVSKKVGYLKMAYLGRVARIKNLKFALNLIRKIDDVNIEYDIYGILDDAEYWEGCRELIKKMPQNITVRYKGHVEHEEVPETLADYHLFFLPTKSENFGHAIYESLLSGTPVLISDQTPWSQLKSKNLGWDIPLDEKGQFFEIIRNIAGMNSDEINRIKENTFKNIRQEKVEAAVEQNRKVLTKLTCG